MTTLGLGTRVLGQPTLDDRAIEPIAPWSLAVPQPLTVETFECVGCAVEHNVDDMESFSTADGLVCEQCLDEYTTCDTCSEYVNHYDINATVREGEYVCDSCVSAWYWRQCAECSNYLNIRTSSHIETPSLVVCSSCYANSGNYYYCENCDEYYHVDNLDDHDHDHEPDICCEAPHQSFAMRNGSELLPNDVMVTLTSPGGQITRTGLGEIAYLLRTAEEPFPYVDNDLAGMPDVNEWQTKRGNFPKRLSSHFYRKFERKIPAELLAQIGNVARAHTSEATNYRIAFTRDLNMSATEYAHEDSCWFTEYANSSRCALKANGGMAMRSFASGGWVTGRVWVMPMTYNTGRHDKLRPTFDTAGADCFMVFNGYGDLSGYTAARLLAGMYGFTYKKLKNISIGPMYINDSRGYIVGPESIISAFESDTYVHVVAGSYCH